MTDKKPDLSQRQAALSRWITDGGATRPTEALTDIPPLTNAELVQLHVRTIALENLLIALLAEGSDRQLELARDMAAYIAPRPGYTQHPATLHAARQMNHLVDRAGHFRAGDL